MAGLKRISGLTSICGTNSDGDFVIGWLQGTLNRNGFGGFAEAVRRDNGALKINCTLCHQDYAVGRRPGKLVNFKRHVMRDKHRRVEAVELVETGTFTPGILQKRLDEADLGGSALWKICFWPTRILKIHCTTCHQDYAVSPQNGGLDLFKEHVARDIHITRAREAGMPTIPTYEISPNGTQNLADDSADRGGVWRSCQGGCETFTTIEKRQNFVRCNHCDAIYYGISALVPNVPLAIDSAGDFEIAHLQEMLNRNGFGGFAVAVRRDSTLKINCTLCHQDYAVGRRPGKLENFKTHVMTDKHRRVETVKQVETDIPRMLQRKLDEAGFHKFAVAVWRIYFWPKRILKIRCTTCHQDYAVSPENGGLKLFKEHLERHKHIGRAQEAGVWQSCRDGCEAFTTIDKRQILVRCNCCNAIYYAISTFVPSVPLATGIDPSNTGRTD